MSLLDGHPVLRATYYVLSMLCGVAIAVVPSAARAIAIGESAANLALLLVGFMLAYLSMLDSAAGPGPMVNPFTPETIANFAISAAWGYVSYARGLQGLVVGRRGVES
ncbi:MAG TPA: hypothetical protein VF761_14290 [Gemmatimonadaceae bacterium]